MKTRIIEEKEGNKIFYRPQRKIFFFIWTDWFKLGIFNSERYRSTCKQDAINYLKNKKVK